MVDYAAHLLCGQRPGWGALSSAQWQPHRGLDVTTSSLARMIARSGGQDRLTVWAWPLNIGNHHWVLAILDQPRRQLRLYDSFASFPVGLRDWLQAASSFWLPPGPGLAPDGGTVMIPQPLQHDSHSCGPLTLLMIHNGGVPCSVPADALAAYRQHWIRIMLEGDQDPPAPPPPPPALLDLRGHEGPLADTTLAAQDPVGLERDYILLPIPNWKGRALRVAQSSLPNAGLGLFTLRPVQATSSLPSRILCTYAGRTLTRSQVDRSTSAYIWENSTGDYIVDAEDPLSCYGRYINDHFDEAECNCEIRMHKGRAVVVALQEDIPAGSELFLSYGRDYWRDKLPALPNEVASRCARKYTLPWPPVDRALLSSATTAPLDVPALKATDDIQGWNGWARPSGTDGHGPPGRPGP